MSDALNMIAYVIQLGAFGAALVAVLFMPVRPGGFMRVGIKLLLGGAMAIYTFVGFSHILQQGAGITAFDIYENYLKVLFLPLVATAAYAIQMNEQLRLTEAQARVLSAEHDMLMRIVDTTPNGMAVLTPDGRIEFANDRAKQMLELEEDADTGAFLTPVWKCEASGIRGDLGACADGKAVRDHACALVWPDGTRRPLLLNATPIISADGTVVGSVVAFIATETASQAG